LLIAPGNLITMVAERRRGQTYESLSAMN
jgi:hypothetical protein